MLFLSLKIDRVIYYAFSSQISKQDLYKRHTPLKVTLSLRIQLRTLDRTLLPNHRDWNPVSVIGADALDSDSVMSMVIQMVIRGVQRTTNMEKIATKV